MLFDKIHQNNNTNNNIIKYTKKNMIFDDKAHQQYFYLEAFGVLLKL